MLLASTRDDCVWSTGGSGGRERGREGGREGGIIITILPIAERKGRREGMARANERQ